MPFLVALAFALVLTPVLARFGPVLGLVDHPSGDGLKIHREPKPITGGIALSVAMLCALVVVDGVPDGWALTGILLLLAVGVTDDLVKLPPLVRLVSELAAGGLLALSGATFAPLGPVGPATVVLAVPALANAVNIVDGQDGLAGGLSVVAAAGITVILAAGGDAGAIGPALVAALLAFLVWNRPPARVFLGDGGAYVVGGVLVLLAASASRSWESLAGVVVCLGVLLLELGSTVVRRALARESLVSGDRDHAYDLLAVLLSSRPRSTAVMVGVGTALAGLGWIAAEVSLSAGASIAMASVVVCTAGVVVLWRNGRTQARRSR